MAGTPAVIGGGTGIHSMFYRTSTNTLVHVSRPPLIWSRPNVLLSDVIADPAAVSLGPGRFDVVALGRDYKFYHITRNGSHTSVEVVSEHVKGLGQPTLIASGGDRLDLFYRSWNRRLYHATKIGDAPWIVSDVGGRMVDLPTAIRLGDGTFRAYVRGLNGDLWESTRTAEPLGLWSAWTSLSEQTGSGSIQGSPTVAVVDGKLSVFARTGSSNMLKFVLGKAWIVSEQAGSYTGSPTASRKGIFARDSGGALNFSDGSKRTDLGGSLD